MKAGILFEKNSNAKIVRDKNGRFCKGTHYSHWKGKKYTAFTLETESCTIEGREKDGWMKYGEFDYLLYGFVQQDNNIELYVIPFQKLKKWFWENYKNFQITETNQINRTRCRIVDIKEVETRVGFKKFYL